MRRNILYIDPPTEIDISRHIPVLLHFNKANLPVQLNV